MKYISTRGETNERSFSDTVLTGLAPDGGLMVPAQLPDARDLLALTTPPDYAACAFEIMRRFVDLSDADLKGIINRAYAGFENDEKAPLVPLGDVYLLELFHGPTLAFKDFALQFLGQVFQKLLSERGGELNILGSTSGDTGSAAIHAVRGLDHIRIFMMHPRGRTSKLQELQMTTVLDANVHNLSVEGTFDDCQRLMKQLFGDVAFKEQYHLGAVNSVNWARILAQIVYYWYAGLQALHRHPGKPLRFVVPTGNFGNILAGYLAARMGLPVSSLVVATNENDILHRFFSTGVYETSTVQHTLSPSMDIQVASNFERYLYFASGENPTLVRDWMQTFAQTGRLEIQAHLPLFSSGRCGEQEILAVTSDIFKTHGYLLDPHTATGIHTARNLPDADVTTICLATAHPAKFPETVARATGVTPTHPTLDALRDMPSRVESVPNEREALRAVLIRDC